MMVVAVTMVDTVAAMIVAVVIADQVGATNMCRYHLNLKEKCLIDGKTGEILRPDCFDNLAAVYSYYLGRKQAAQAEELIKEVFKEHKPITNMIAKFHEKSGLYPAYSDKKGKK